MRVVHHSSRVSEPLQTRENRSRAPPRIASFPSFLLSVSIFDWARLDCFEKIFCWGLHRVASSCLPASSSIRPVLLLDDGKFQVALAWYLWLISASHHFATVITTFSIPSQPASPTLNKWGLKRLPLHSLHPWPVFWLPFHCTLQVLPHGLPPGWTILDPGDALQNGGCDSPAWLGNLQGPTIPVLFPCHISKFLRNPYQNLESHSNRGGYHHLNQFGDRPLAASIKAVQGVSCSFNAFSSLAKCFNCSNFGLGSAEGAWQQWRNVHIKFEDFKEKW